MQHAASPCGGRPRSRSNRVRSWSCDVRKVSVDERTPRPVVSGKFFADEDDAGRRTWEATVTLPLTASVDVTPAPPAAWQIATASSLGEVEDILDSLEAHGVTEREVVTLQNNMFAVRWR